MAFDPSHWRRWTSIACVVLAVAAAVAGGSAFLLSLRPCRLQLDPGTVVDFQLVTEYREMREDGLGPPRETTSRITLVCIGHDNEVALVEPDGAQDGISLLSFQSNGTARLLGEEGLTDVGKALGFFDFNLLPLPPGNEQTWKVSLVYAALPPDKRQVSGQVRRTENSSRPEFELRLPTVEWVNAQQRYMQVRNLVCAYRFDPSRGVVDKARVTCEAGVEREAGAGENGRTRYRVQVSLDLLAIQRGNSDTAGLRDLALASAATQQALANSHWQRLAPLVARLERQGTAVGPLREIANRLRIQANGRLSQGDTPRDTPRDTSRIRDGQRGVIEQPRQQQQQQTEQHITVAAAGGWELQIASIANDRRPAAETLVSRCLAAGIPARIEVRGKWLAVRAGPFAERDAQLTSRVQAISRNAPQWRQITP